jgi:cell wall-associated NlpC family hydrolase
MNGSISTPQPLNSSTDQRWYFSDPEKSKALILEAEDWYQKRTPWRRNSCAKGAGGGSDCAFFAQAVLQHAGAIPRFSFPRRPRDYSPHIYNEKILGYLRGTIHDPQSRVLAAIFAELPPDTWPLMTGDLIAMKSGVELYHFPIVTEPPRFVQCAAPEGVSKGDAGDPFYRKMIVAVFRARSLPSSQR